MIERCIIYDYNGLWFRPPTAMFKKLLNEIPKYSCISRALEYLRKDDTILGVCRKNLISLVTVEFGNLQRCRADRRPAGPSKTNSFIASGLVHIDQVIGSEIR
jgi:hypothetical protein